MLATAKILASGTPRIPAPHQWERRTPRQTRTEFIQREEPVKRSIIALAFVFVSTLSAHSQVAEVTVKPLSDDDIKLIRQDIQTAREGVIKDTMQFSDAEGTAFWPVYKQYAGEQHAIADKRLAIIMDYAKHVDDMSDADAHSLTQRMLQIEDDTQSLRKKYFPKFESILGAKRAAKFYQVDNRLTMIMNVQLASDVPLIQ
jgi:hypothetical protein